LPPGLRISPGLARQALDTFLERVTPVALTAAESVETLRGCAARNLAGGIIYDALHLACARKAAADQIYTWNLRHFRLAAPDLADRIQTP
jgi:predicted nucleic acid-binding protein